MEGPKVFLIILLGVFAFSYDSVFGSVLEVTVRYGDSTTLHCDCKVSSGVYIVWYRNCSHENQPSLAIPIKLPWSMVNTDEDLKIFPRFQFVRNFSSETYDLMIMDVTDSDEGLYYCGTEQTKVEKERLTSVFTRTIYRYGSITKMIVVNSSEFPYHELPPESGVCCTLLFSLCPAFALLSSLLVFDHGQKKDDESQVQQERADTRGRDEDVFLTRVLYLAQEG